MEQEAIDEKLDKGYLHCRIMIEILGAPKQHVEGTLALVLKKLREEKDVDVIYDKVHPAEEKDKLFSTFAEVELLFKDFVVLTRICFDYLPSSVEIVKPENFKMSSLELSNFVSDTLAMLHGIDFKLKDVNAANQLLERNSANLLKNFLLIMLSSGKKPIGEVSKLVGIKPEQLEPFMQAFTKEGLIRKSGELWEKCS